MAPNIGFSAIFLALLLSLLQSLFTIYNSLSKNANDQQLLSLTKSSSAAIFSLSLISFLSLIYSYIISDFSVENVYLNSHKLKPLIYKISGAWGNHEGSILLLSTILSAYGLAFAFLSNASAKIKNTTLCVQSLINFGILAFIIFTSNPFLPIFPTPDAGLGLNPILQDIGLAMHPPMLYTGYIGFSIVFSITICALLNEKIDKNFAKIIRPWLLFSWSLLTLGIGLGSWWAYRELGWGGYWFWDPVENVSLMPWLCATALLHSVMVLEKTGNFKIWSSFLAILSFVLCLLGIFLVRSGVLTSVHSFANDPKRGVFIVLLLLLIGGGGFLIFSIKSLKIKSSNSEYSISSKVGLVLINNFLLCLALFIVVLGTLYPLILQSFDVSISVGAPYYKKMLTPLAILILFLMMFVPYLKNDKAFVFDKKIIKKLLIMIFFSCLCLVFLFKTDFEIKLLPVLALFFAILVLLSSILNKKINASSYSMFLGHGAISVIIIAISVGSLLSSSKEMNVKVGEEINIAHYRIKFKDIDHKAGKNYIARIGVFQLENGDILRPESRYYPISNQSTTEASIKHDIFADLYVVLGQKDEKSENFAVRIYYKPLMSFVWVGCLMLFFAGMLSLMRRKND